MAGPTDPKDKAAYDAAIEASLAPFLKNAPQYAANPRFGQNVFNPNSYIPNTYGTVAQPDPNKAEPLPYGAYVDPRIPSDLNATRASQVQGMLANPRKYVQDHAPQLAAEQSLLDKGKTMLSQLFDYKDDADWHMGPVNLSGVESVWDSAVAHFTGAYDLLNIGFGGLISAMPGGVQTLDYNTLSGGKSVGDVLSGQMEQGSAPSPGQIAIASIAKESKRIREGGQRWSDLLLLNPATAPFILAGIAAPDSPLQADNFDITNKGQRDAAFGTGWEQWMSGITDAGLSFADPLIGAGVAAKAMRLGLLGARGSGFYARAMGTLAPDAADEVIGHITGAGKVAGASNREIDSLVAQAAPMQKGGARGSIFDTTAEGVPADKVPPYVTANAREQSALDQVKNGIDPEPPKEYLLTRNVGVLDRPAKFKNPLAQFLYDVTLRNADGEKVMSKQALQQRPEFKALNANDKDFIVDALHHTDSPTVASLILRRMSGDATAMSSLVKLAPAAADAMMRYSYARLFAMRAAEPQKMREAASAFERKIESIKQMKSKADELITPELERSNPDMFARLKNQQAIFQQTLDDAEHYKNALVHNVEEDALVPYHPGYDPARAEAIMNDLHRQTDDLTKALNKDIQDAAVGARTFFPAVDNAYSRMVMASRARRTNAAYQYLAEGTSILPRKVRTATETSLNAEGQVVTNKPVEEWTGWFAKSHFDGTNRLQRAARVWRWFGTETPSGYIGLNGTALVGSNREFTAAINDIRLYKGDPVMVTRSYFDKEGQRITETVPVGGTARQAELIDMWNNAVTNPNVDKLHALTDIEDEIAKDLRMAYGVDEKQMDEIMNRSKHIKQANLDLIRTRGYFIDPVDGSRHYVPFLESQLANGTYMHNFGAFEKELSKTSSLTLNRKMQTVQSLLNDSYGTFNDFWRPLTLLRLSYTTRNVAEGMVRAMAYSGSLAPLAWPVKASAYGVRNAWVSARAGKKYEAARDLVADTTYASLRDDLINAKMQLSELMTEVHRTKNTVTYKRVLPSGSVVDAKREVTVSAKKHAEMVAAAEDRIKVAEEVMKANLDDFERSIDNTHFGAWRKAQLGNLRHSIEEAKKEADEYEKTIEFAVAAGRINDQFDAEAIGAVRSANSELIGHYERVEHELRYNPNEALSAYRDNIGRQKRIGSGTSLGPDGLMYEDAFAGAYAHIHRNNLSNDNTVKAQLTARANALESLWRRMAIKTNVAVPYLPSRLDDWLKGMTEAIETGSSSHLVQRMAAHEWDVDDAVNWVMSGEGMQWYRNVRNSQAGAGHTVERLNKMPDVPSQYLQPGTNQYVTNNSILPELSGASHDAPDVKELRAYITAVREIIYSQMQHNPDFLGLLERRSLEKHAEPVIIRDKGAATVTDPSKFASGTPERSTFKAVQTIHDQMSAEQRSKLGYVQGSQMIDEGTPAFMHMWQRLTGALFKVLGTIPEDAVVRAPFYNMRFKAVRNDLIALYLQNSGRGHLLKGRSPVEATGRAIGNGIEHEEFRIPAAELSRIMYKAHTVALSDTKEWLYTIDRRTKLGKYGEPLFPFISATQNSVTVMGKLLYKEPWLAPMIVDMWRMPNRVGFEDEQGNLHIPMPLPWVRDILKNHPEIPFIGGAIDSHDEITIPKNGLNLWMPETGFGLAPTPTPLVQVPASELMKANVFPVETPQILVNIFGKEGADSLYQNVKDWMFGQGQGISEKTGSYDLLIPAVGKLVLQSRDEMSKQYGAEYALQYATQMMRLYAHERSDVPTNDEIGQRTTNMFWMNIAGQLGIPTPAVPYPTLTRPHTVHPASVLQDVMRAAQAIDPKNANLNMYNLFGDVGLQAATSKVGTNIGGASATAAAVSDIHTFSHLITKVSAEVGGNLDVLGIITNNRDSVVTVVPGTLGQPATQKLVQNPVDQAAIDAEMATRIPGRSETWRAIQSPQEATAERQKINGWTVYMKFMDMLNAQVKAAGLPNYNVKAAAPYKAARDQFIRNMEQNPDYAGWAVDFMDPAGSKAQAAVRTMELATQDPTFRAEMIAAGKETLLGIMGNYVQYRAMLVNIVKASGKPLSDPVNAPFKDAWDTMRMNWDAADVRWSDISKQFLSSDDNPKFAGMDNYSGGN